MPVGHGGVHLNELMAEPGGFWSMFNAVDAVAAVLLAVGIFTGMRRGLSGELARLIGAGVSLYAGWFFYQPAGQYLFKVTRLSSQGASALAFVLVIVGAGVLMILLRLVLRHIMEFTFKGPIERVGGALAGLLRSAVVVTAAILVLSLWPHEYLHRVFAEDSFCGRLIYTYLEPVYEEWSEKYPLLPDMKKPGDEEEDSSSEQPARDKPAKPSEPEAEEEP